MKKCFAEVMEGGKRVEFSFLVDDQSEPPKRGELSDFQPPEKQHLYGQAYLAYVEFRNRTAGALGGTVVVGWWEEV